MASHLINMSPPAHYSPRYFLLSLQHDAGCQLICIITHALVFFLQSKTTRINNLNKTELSMIASHVLLNYHEE